MKKRKIPFVSLDDIEAHCSHHKECEEDFVTLLSRTFVHRSIRKEEREPYSPSCETTEQHSLLPLESCHFQRKLDMHGMRVATAYQSLLLFIQDCYTARLEHVLIITGKGKHSAGNKSILRESVFSWFDEYPLVEVIHTYDTPHRKHGGNGAIAVRLKPYNRNKVIRWKMSSLSSFNF